MQKKGIIKKTDNYLDDLQKNENFVILKKYGCFGDGKTGIFFGNNLWNDRNNIVILDT